MTLLEALFLCRSKCRNDTPVFTVYTLECDFHTDACDFHTLRVEQLYYNMNINSSCRHIAAAVDFEHVCVSNQHSARHCFCAVRVDLTRMRARNL
jgi:hypothetical protein